MKRGTSKFAGSGSPRYAAWRHHDAREGFEVAFLDSEGGCLRIDGHTAAVEDGEGWAIRYAIALGPDWATRSARVFCRSLTGRQERRLESDGTGGWRVDGAPASHLDGCLDVDLESSALTNALPVNRLGLAVGEEADAPAAYVRAQDLAVERLEQRYVRLEDQGERQRYHYASPAFGFECQITFDAFGLALEYPGIATRAA